MKLPGQLQAEYAIKGIWGALIAAAFLIVVAFATVQTVRLEGFKFWPLSIEGARPKAERLERDLANVRAAQRLAEQAAAQQRIFWKNHYRNRARETDLANATETQPRAADDADRYIAANRVQSCPAGGASGAAAAPAAGERAGGGDRPGDMPVVDDRRTVPGNGEEQLFPDLVAVSPEDIRACTRNTARLLDAQAWGVTLERESTAGKTRPD